MLDYTKVDYYKYAVEKVRLLSLLSGRQDARGDVAAWGWNHTLPYQPGLGL